MTVTLHPMRGLKPILMGLAGSVFDPTNRQSATEEYVRLAIGFDYPSAAPVRGSRYGGGMEELSVRVQVEQTQS